MSEEEKLKYTSKIKDSGSYRGYKLRQLWASTFMNCLGRCLLTHMRYQAIEGEVLDQIEHYQCTYELATDVSVAS